MKANKVRTTHALLGAWFCAIVGTYIYFGLLFGFSSDAALISGSIATFGGEVVTLAMISRRSSEYDLAVDCLRALEHLEAGPSRWRDPVFRGTVNSKLEKVATDLEKVFRQLQPHDLRTRHLLAERSSAAAAGIRDLKLWVAQPNPFTFTDLADHLIRSLEIILDGRWFDLPRGSATDDLGARRLQRIIGIVAGFVLAGGSLAIYATAQSSLAGKVLSPILGLVGFGLLGIVGLPGQSASELGELSRKLGGGT
jgi:hypothetical protein